MADTFTQLYYHFVWATKYREPALAPELETQVFAYIRHKCAEMNVLVHALGGALDHVHLACTLPTTLCIADLLESIKGSSSHFANHTAAGDFTLYWQPGYGALTVSKRDLPYVVAYINNQKAHHADGKMNRTMERCSGQE